MEKAPNITNIEEPNMPEIDVQAKLQEVGKAILEAIPKANLILAVWDPAADTISCAQQISPIGLYVILRQVVMQGSPAHTSMLAAILRETEEIASMSKGQPAPLVQVPQGGPRVAFGSIKGGRNH